ncbi:hypothetical protein [Paenibacillus sp. UNC496MF]|uniref:hypothetical protein n=1 Tax=Paenibacillus sp. UNC496MF TaxID=1502753 RepID=UPI001C430E56|nr:hypothetical protein [Paenibacillus sp. UNC496MF]
MDIYQIGIDAKDIFDVENNFLEAYGSPQPELILCALTGLSGGASRAQESKVGKMQSRF